MNAWMTQRIGAMYYVCSSDRALDELVTAVVEVARRLMGLPRAWEPAGNLLIVTRRVAAVD